MSTDAPYLATLSTGVRVVVVPMPDARTVAIEVAIGGGLLHETPATAGLAHLCEHMLVYRTRRRTPEELGIALDRLSPSHEATTTATAVSLSFGELLPEDLDRAVALVGEIVTEPAFLPSEVEAEKRIVELEIRADLSDDGQHGDVSDLAHAVVFGGTTLAIPSCGNLYTVRSLSAADLDRWHARHVVGRNVVVAITGAVDVERALVAVERSFRSLPPGDRLEPNAVPLLQSELRTKVSCGLDPDDEEEEERNPDAPVTLGLGMRAEFGRGDARADAAEVLSRVLDGASVSSRLYRALRLRDPLAYDFEAAFFAYPTTGVLEIRATVAASEVTKAIGEILDVLGLLAFDGPTGDELQTLAERLRREAIDPEDLAADLADELLHGDVETTEEARVRLTSVTRDQVRDVARELFQPRRLSIVAIGPTNGSELRQAVVAKAIPNRAAPTPTLDLSGIDVAAVKTALGSALPRWAGPALLGGLVARDLVAGSRMKKPPLDAGLRALRIKR